MSAVMGAEAFAERARRELLATGEIMHERTNMQVSALTAGEAHIARLAADGITNPGIAAQLYLSVRIADRHDGPFGEKTPAIPNGMWFCRPRRRAPGQGDERVMETSVKVGDTAGKGRPRESCCGRVARTSRGVCRAGPARR
jgi:hypothetical protein